MGKNSDPSPMEHTSVRLTNARMERSALSRNAGDMGATEIRSEATRLGIPIAGAKSKDDLVEAVQAAVNPA